MQTVAITAARPYKVHIGNGLMSNAGELLREIRSPGKLALIADENVAAIYGDAVRAAFERYNFRVFFYTFPAGEASKNIHELEKLLETLAGWEFGRHDMLAALGGGVTGDLAGFAASVYQRGIEYIQLPTTLLAAVDSSVGGKTAINLSAGKNLAGSFWQPSMVICDCDTFSTLPGSELASGGAECVKYAMLGTTELMDILTRDGLSCNWSDIVLPCVEHKAAIVQQDERETGIRALLNFGHTFGHAAELCSGYTIRHGAGVAMGMMLITTAAAKYGLCKPDVVETLKAALTALELPTTCPYSAKDIANAALGDKKRNDGKITLIVPKSVGECILYPVDTDELVDIIRAGGAE